MTPLPSYITDYLRHFWFVISCCIVLLSSPLAWAYSPYSTRELDELEKEFVQQINQSDSILRNPLANQYINHLAKRLALHGHLSQPYFFIVKSNEINAFAGPGGHIGINTQLILATENESELAAVMSHEMAHVRLHHLYRMMEHQKQMRVPMLASLLASIALGAINPALGTGAAMASMTGMAQDNINFVRSNEKEADRIGIDMLIKSGLDPRGMAAFFKKMQQNARYYYTDNIPAILRTHPMDEDRIAEAENRSLHLDYKPEPDNLDYRLFKEIVRTSVVLNSKSLLDYYEHQCPQHTNPLACQYGHALTQLDLNQNAQAEARLAPLLQQDPNNLYYAITMAEAETALQQFDRATTKLNELQANYPDHYAVIMASASNLMAAGHAEKATSLLLKASRVFKTDLPICQALARAQAAMHRQDYAYFTAAQCHLLQGQKKDAIRRLTLAKTLITKDRLLKARIDAKLEEIQLN